MKYDAIMITARDNVATALRDLAQRQECRLSELVAGSDDLAKVPAWEGKSGFLY